jgi:hypothetical protein
MAHRAPMSLSTTYDVFDDAVDRLRQILSHTHQFDHQPDVALKHIIDDGVKESVGLGKYRKIIDYLGKQVSDALIVELPDRIGKGVFAVVKPDLHGRKVPGGGVKQIVLSVQDQEQVNWNLVNGKWKHEGQPGQAMGKLGSKMSKDLLSKAIDVAAKKVAEEEAKHLTRWRILWRDDEDKECISGPYDSRQDMLAAAEELVSEGGSEDMKFQKEVLVPTWVDVKAKVKIELDE